MAERPIVRVVVDSNNEPRVYVDGEPVPGSPAVEIEARHGLPTFSIHHPTAVLPRFSPSPATVTLTYSRVDIEVQYLDRGASSEPPTAEQLAAIDARVQAPGEQKRPFATGGIVGMGAAIDAYTEGMDRLCHSQGPTPEQLDKLKAEITALGGTIIPLPSTETTNG